MLIHKQDLVEYLPDSTKDNYDGRRQALIDLARLAENAERFEDMCKIVRAVVELDSNQAQINQETHILTTEERNLLSVAYKHVVSNRRTSWRTLNSDEGRGNEFIIEYRQQLESELDEICREVLSLLENHLIPSQRRAIEETKAATPGQPMPRSFQRELDPSQGQPISQETINVSLNLHKEGLVFYLKLCGDYYRYLAEFQTQDRTSHEKARIFYAEAYDLAKERLHKNTEDEVLPRTNPVRLGLALNYSVCFYEILEEKEQACALAREAFDAALAKLDELDEHQYKDSTLILMLLRDNLTLWSENHDKNQGDEYIPQ